MSPAPELSFSRSWATVTGDNPLKTIIGAPFRTYLQRSFAPKSKSKAIIYYEPRRVPFAQIYPFLYYSQEFFQRYAIEFRFAPISCLEQAGLDKFSAANIVIFQNSFQKSADGIAKLLTALEEKHAGSTIFFFDSYAPLDLRLAKFLSSHIHYYVKKSLFMDREQYFQPTMGHTNLEDYYRRAYDMPCDLHNWHVPRDILAKLRIGPHFFLAPNFIGKMQQSRPLSDYDRPIDIHARLGVTGSPWYSRMRQEAVRAVSTIPHIKSVTRPGIPRPRYMRELYQSKLCFSPFGYGELCWRDIEAFLAGAVLIKPDMGHVQTEPNLFIPHETYLPVRWDFADLADVVHKALADPPKCRDMAEHARTRIRAYLREKRFVDDMGILMSS